MQRQPYSPKDECQLIYFPAILLHKSKIIQNISWFFAELLLHFIKLCLIFFFCFCFAWITTHVNNNFLLSFNFKECKLVCASQPHIIKQTVDFSIELYPWQRLYQENIKNKINNLKNLIKLLKLLLSQKLVRLVKLLIWNVLSNWTQIRKMKHFCSIEMEKIKTKVGI